MRLPNYGSDFFLQRVKELMEKWSGARRYFFAYDKAGERIIPTNWTDVVFDTASLVESSFRYANGAVTLLVVGRFDVQAEITAQAEAVAGYAVEMRLAQNTGGGWSEIPGSRAGFYCHNDSLPYGSASVRLPLLGYKKHAQIKVQVKSNHVTDVITTPHSCRLYIEQKNYGD